MITYQILKLLIKLDWMAKANNKNRNYYFCSFCGMKSISCGGLADASLINRCCIAIFAAIYINELDEWYPEVFPTASIYIMRIALHYAFSISSTSRYKRILNHGYLSPGSQPAYASHVWCILEWSYFNTKAFQQSIIHSNLYELVIGRHM